MRVALCLHLLAMTAWIGGMFFAHMALRPAVAQLLPPQRLALLAAIMTRFLAWVALAIVVLFATGGWMLVQGGAAMATPGVRAMAGIAVVMTLVYGYIVARPSRTLRASVAELDWPRAGAAMGIIRPLILVNLVLGVAAIIAATLLR